MPKSGVHRLANNKKAGNHGNMMMFGRKGGLSSKMAKDRTKGITKK